MKKASSLRKVVARKLTGWHPADGSLTGENFSRTADQERRNRARDLIASATQADAFDASHTEMLAHRDLFPDAVALLTKLVGWHNQPGAVSLSAALWSTADGDSTLALRLACGLNLMPPPACLDHVRVDRAWLRSRGTEAANVALALAGEVSWPDASPRVRAGFVLHHVVANRRAAS